MGTIFKSLLHFCRVAVIFDSSLDVCIWSILKTCNVALLKHDQIEWWHDLKRKVKEEKNHTNERKKLNRDLGRESSTKAWAAT